MELADIIKELGSMPKETLVYKTIKGKKQPYLQWSEAGKTKSRYIRISEREELLKQFEKKEYLKKLYSEAISNMVDSSSDLYYVSEAEKPYNRKMACTHEQLISKKETTGIYSVERKYINSKEYHDKFAKLPLSHEVQEAIYREAGRLLEFVDGKPEEHMIAISSRNGFLITDNFSRQGMSDHTSFSEEEYNRILVSNDSVILLHNHSSNGRPSARDIISYAMDDNVRLSLILCHDGSVYALCDANKNVEMVFNDLLEKEKERWNDIKLAKIHATNDLYRLNDKLGKNHKLFELRRL